MKDFENKLMQFITALQDVYREEENRALSLYPHMELTEDSLTEDFTAMFYALFVIYKQITGNDIGILDFVAICNKLSVQRLRKLDKENLGDEQRRFTKDSITNPI